MSNLYVYDNSSGTTVARINSETGLESSEDHFKSTWLTMVSGPFGRTIEAIVPTEETREYAMKKYKPGDERYLEVVAEQLETPFTGYRRGETNVIPPEKHMDTKKEAEKRAEAVRNGVKNVERAFIHKYVEPSDDEFQDEVFDVDEDEYWVPYTSPQGEDGWKSLDGDEIVFTDQPPGPTPVWVDRDEVTQDIAVEGERGEDEE